MPPASRLTDQATPGSTRVIDSRPMIAPLPAPVQRTRPPLRAARVCMNGHLVDARLEPPAVADVATNRADPLAVRTTSLACPTCGAGTILGCPGCGYPIPGERPAGRYAVPHFCIVCGEFYPWTFRGEFYATLAEILEESPSLDPAKREHGLASLDRLREGLAGSAEVRRLAATFAALGGTDAQLAGEILDVVLTGRADLAAVTSASQA